jgi:hypothetical protein
VKDKSDQDIIEELKIRNRQLEERILELTKTRRTKEEIVLDICFLLKIKDTSFLSLNRLNISDLERLEESIKEFKEMKR